MYLYRLGRFLFFLYFKLVNRLTVVGKEHFPRHAGILICSNHISNFDPPLVGVAAPRIVRFMAKDELFSVPLLKSVLPALGTYPVKRGIGDKHALRKGIAILNDGEVMGLFPEGTRSKTGELGTGLAGAGFFALRSNAIVIPCAIVGSFRPFKKVKVIFGKPVELEKMKNEKASAKDATTLIMKDIGKLLEAEARNI